MAYGYTIFFNSITLSWTNPIPKDPKCVQCVCNVINLDFHPELILLLPNRDLLYNCKLSVCICATPVYSIKIKVCKFN